MDIRVEDSLAKEIGALEVLEEDMEEAKKKKTLIEGKVGFKCFQAKDTHFHDKIKSSYRSTTYLTIFLGFE